MDLSELYTTVTEEMDTEVNAEQLINEASNNPSHPFRKLYTIRKYRLLKKQLSEANFNLFKHGLLKENHTLVSLEDVNMATINDIKQMTSGVPELRDKIVNLISTLTTSANTYLNEAFECDDSHYSYKKRASPWRWGTSLIPDEVAELVQRVDVSRVQRCFEFVATDGGVRTRAEEQRVPASPQPHKNAQLSNVRTGRGTYSTRTENRRDFCALRLHVRSIEKFMDVIETLAKLYSICGDDSFLQRQEQLITAVQSLVEYDSNNGSVTDYQLKERFEKLDKLLKESK